MSMQNDDNYPLRKTRTTSLIAESPLALQVNHALIAESRFGPVNRAIGVGDPRHPIWGDAADHREGTQHVYPGSHTFTSAESFCYRKSWEPGSNSGAGLKVRAPDFYPSSQTFITPHGSLGKRPKLV